MSQKPSTSQRTLWVRIVALVCAGLLALSALASVFSFDTVIISHDKSRILRYTVPILREE